MEKANEKRKCEHIWNEGDEEGTAFKCILCGEATITLMSDIYRYLIYDPVIDKERIIADVIIDDDENRYIISFNFFEKNRRCLPEEHQRMKLIERDLIFDSENSPLKVFKTLDDARNFIQKYAKNRNLIVEQVIPPQGSKWDKRLSDYIDDV